MGYISDVCTLRSFNKKHVGLYDAFIFSRPRFSRRLLKIVDKLSQGNKLFIADYDDLLFDPEAADCAPHVLMGLASSHSVAIRFREYQKALELFPIVVTATQPLADAALKISPESNIKVVYNGLSQRWVNNATRFSFTKSTNIIGYFPGTRSHNHDFGLVAKSLADHLHDHPQTRLMIVGSLDFDIDLFPKQQLMRHSGVEYDQLPALIKSCSVTLAPLADNAFNQCKSGLKFFESAIYGVPIIASPIPDMQRFSGASIDLASHSSEWLGALVKIEHGSSVGPDFEHLKTYAQTHCMSEQQTRHLLRIINENTGPVH